MIKFSIIITALMVAACGHASAANPVLDCQQRIVNATRSDAQTDGKDPDPWRVVAYSKVDKSACSPEQIADLDKLHDLGSRMEPLSQANEDAAATGNEELHMKAFQTFNDALIEYGGLQQAAAAKLAHMKSEAPQ